MAWVKWDKGTYERVAGGKGSLGKLSAISVLGMRKYGNRGLAIGTGGFAETWNFQRYNQDSPR